MLGKIFVRGLFGIDMSGGVLIYALATMAFHQDFSWLYFVLTIIAVHSPDADFVPYLVVKRWLPYPSHRLVGHHPLIAVPLAGLIGWFVGDYYGLTLATTAVVFHFLHDSWQLHGMHWLSPFTWWSVSIRGGWPHSVPEEKRVAALENLRVRIRRDGGEVLARMPELRTGNIFFCGTAWLIFIAFLIMDTLT